MSVLFIHSLQGSRLSRIGGSEKKCWRIVEMVEVSEQIWRPRGGKK